MINTFRSTTNGEKMLTPKQRQQLIEMDKYYPSDKRRIRKRIIDKSVVALEDLVFVTQKSDELPNIKDKVTPDLINSLVLAYFESFGVDIKYHDPSNVIKLMDENTVLMRKNANLQQEIANVTHQIEHFKYLYSHVSQMMEENTPQKVEGRVSAP